MKRHIAGRNLWIDLKKTICKEEKEMRVIVIVNLKGGVGKTTTAEAMAHELSSKYKKQTLLIDNDKQGDLSKVFGLYSEMGTAPVAKLLSRKETDILKLEKPTKYNGIHIIPSNMSLMEETLYLSTAEVSEQLSRYKAILTRAGYLYDYVIIDNPPDIAINVINALAIADDVIIPIKIDNRSIRGMEILTEQIEIAKHINPKINLIGILLTMYKKNDANIAGEGWLREKGYNLFKTKIRNSEKVSESTFFNQSIQEYSFRSAAAVDYRRLVKEYLEKTGGI